MIYKREKYTKFTDEDRPDSINSFIKELIELQKKYNFELSHEDGHGSFQIWDLNPNEDFSWISSACYMQLETIPGVSKRV